MLAVTVCLTAFSDSWGAPKTQVATVQALQLCERFGEVAEAEQHHPDLHLTVRPATLLSPSSHWHTYFTFPLQGYFAFAPSLP